MNARFARVLSRLSIAAVVAASSLGAAACARGPATDPAPTAEAAQAQAASTEQHRPGKWFFRQVDGLDLRAEQRSAVSEIEQNLRADLAPHRETIRQLTLDLADAIEHGQLDSATAAQHKAALLAALGDAKASVATAVNGIHDALDPDQRALLVARLREQHERHRQGAEGQQDAPKHGLAKLAFELGLDENQKAALHDAIQKGVEDVFPDRRARREAWEAKMKAMGDSFVTDEFDAADYDLAEHAEAHLAAVVEVTTRAVEVTGHVLSDAQRVVAADMLRERVQKL
jgi:hypothetical protein